MTIGTEGPYGSSTYEVTTPSNSALHLQTVEEAEWYESRRDRYLADNHFTNVSDLQDLDRLLLMEVLLYRWGLWMGQGYDYQQARVDEKQLKDFIKEYCVSDDTEALTPEGWVSIQDLAPGKPILAYDAESGTTDWQIPTNVYIGQAQGPMLLMESRQHSSLTTKDHRWYVEQRRSPATRSTHEWRTSAELDTQSVIPLAAPFSGHESQAKYTDALVELVAWYWTEGSCTRVKGVPTQGEIGQSMRVNARNVARIEAAFRSEFGAPAGPGERLGYRKAPYWRIERKGDMALFKFGVEVLGLLEHYAPDRVPGPEFYMHLTSAQLRMHIETSLDADGARRQGGAVLAQRDKRRAEYFQMLCVLDGREAWLRLDSRDMWVVSVSNSVRSTRPIFAAHQGKGARAEWVNHDGMIWCPSVPSGAWVARRDGKPFITGNSAELRQVKSSLAIDKGTRDKAKGESLSDFTDLLLRRAKEFGYHRNEQYEIVITKFYELRSMVMTWDRCDEEERRMLDLTADSILEWIRDKVIKDFDEHSEAFRKTQTMWIQELQ